MCKKHPYRIGSAIALPSEETLQEVTVTVMVNDCATISISDMSAVFKYYMVTNKSDTLCLN